MIKRNILYVLMFFCAYFSANAQIVCTQTFSVSGQDDGPTILTINASDITCNGAETITALQLVNASGDFTSIDCSTTGGDWFGFNLSIDGGTPTSVCENEINGTSILGFNTLTVTSQDNDAFSDGITLEIDVEVTYMATMPPNCDAILTSPNNGDTNASDSGNLVWSAAVGGVEGYNVTVGTTSGGTDVLTTTNVGNVLTYALGGLLSNTQYFVTIQPYNSIGAANNCTEYSFTTYTAPQTPNGVACSVGGGIPFFTETFGEDETIDPTGWTGTGFSGTPGNWDITSPNTNTNNSGPEFSFNGSNGVHLEYEGNQSSTGVASAISPAIDLTNGIEGVELSFYMHAKGDNIGTFNVNISNNATGPFTNVFTWSGQAQPNTTDAWDQVGVDLSAYLGQIIYLEFTCQGAGTGNRADIAIDQIEVKSCGTTCNSPIDINIFNYTFTQVQIMWTPQSGESSWNYMVQPVGSGVPSGTVDQTNTPSITVSGLDPAIEYEFYVQADCGSEQSNWVGPVFIENSLDPSTVGDAQVLSDSCFLITPDEFGQAGAVWYDNPIDMTADFEIIFDANFGTNDSDGADGMSFIMKTNANPEIGNTGIGLGYEGITPSIAVEFDTFDNGFNGDGSSDHIAILSNGETNHTLPSNLVGPVQASATSGNIEDGNFHEIKISWQAATQTFNVYFDCDLRASYTGDIVANFLDNMSTAYFGFAGSTGGFKNRHELCFKYISFVDNLNLLNKVICSGDTVMDVDATYTGAATYSWTPATNVSDTAIANPTFTPTETTEYTVEITDSCGQLITDSFTIFVTPNEVATFTVQESCSGAVPTIIGTTGGTFAFKTVTKDGAVINSATGVVTNAASNTTYVIEYTTPGSGLCPSESSTISFTTSSPFSVLTPNNLTVCLDTIGLGLDLTQVEAEIIDNSANNYVITYHTSMMDAEDGVSAISNPVAYSASANETVYIRVEETMTGCFAITTTSIAVVAQCTIPSGISPNNDNLNESFDVTWLEATNIQIFNRFGTKVYQKRDYRNEWFGTTEDNRGGKELPTGTYYYVIEVAKKSPITGWIYVNREK